MEASPPPACRGAMRDADFGSLRVESKPGGGGRLRSSNVEISERRKGANTSGAGFPLALWIIPCSEELANHMEEFWNLMLDLPKACAFCSGIWGLHSPPGHLQATGVWERFVLEGVIYSEHSDDGGRNNVPRFFRKDSVYWPRMRSHKGTRASWAGRRNV